MLDRSGIVPERTPKPSSRSANDLLLFEPGVSASGFYPRVSLKRPKRTALAKLLQESEKSQSHALILVKDDHTLIERYFNQEIKPIELMSITKSIVSLAFGFLLADGKIPSLDTSLSSWYSNWSQDLRSRITLRHVMTHTSGLEDNQTALMSHYQGDSLKCASESKIVDEPGTRFFYNNMATQLLAGVVDQVSGKPLDRFVKEKLFDPLEISDWSWKKDMVGTPQAAYGLSLHARDLTRIGLLMLKDGRWNNTPLLSVEWIRQSTSPGSENTPFYGLLWWLRYDNSGIQPSSTQLQRPSSFYADGWLGQHLIIYPAKGLVATRLHRMTGEGREEEHRQYSFPSFFERVEASV
jgi:CubicO group peptidase (beta-lactamase class C family)